MNECEQLIALLAQARNLAESIGDADLIALTECTLADGAYFAAKAADKAATLARLGLI